MQSDVFNFYVNSVSFSIYCNQQSVWTIQGGVWQNGWRELEQGMREFDRGMREFDRGMREFDRGMRDFDRGMREGRRGIRNARRAAEDGRAWTRPSNAVQPYERVCTKCRETGHSGRECRLCKYCRKWGRLTRDCPCRPKRLDQYRQSVQGQIEAATETGSTESVIACQPAQEVCAKCKETGHRGRRCVLCYSCKNWGHVVRKCPNRDNQQQH